MIKAIRVIRGDNKVQIDKTHVNWEKLKKKKKKKKKKTLIRTLLYEYPG